jgi:hypothetical protein
MSSSFGKRQREQQKRERTRDKAERKADRQVTGAESSEVFSNRSEAELIDDLSALHRALESGDVSPEDFEERRGLMQAQFDQLQK